MMGWDIFIYFAAVCIVASLMASVFSFSNRRILAVATAAVASISLAGFIGLLWISLGRPPLRTMGETRLWYSFFAGIAGVLFSYSQFGVDSKKFDYNYSILVLVFVVLGGLGSMRGSIIAATVLTVLPEMLREFSEYRMLVYAIVLIVMMIATNNATVKNALDGFARKFSFKKKSEKGENANG